MINVPTFSLNTTVVGHNVTVYVSMGRVGNYTVNGTNVTVRVGGVDYVVGLDADGKGSLTLGLPVGNYTAVVSFVGNELYNASASVNASFRVVDKNVTSVVIYVNDTEVENSVVIRVVTNNTEVDAGNVTLMVNGVVVPVVDGGNGVFICYC